MLILHLLTAAGLLAAVAYSMLAVYAVLRFPMGRGVRGRSGKSRPFVSVLKPVRGLDPLRYGRESNRSEELRRDLTLNLTTFFQQDYGGRFEILFGFQEPDDPALPLVEALCARHPHVAARVVRVSHARGPNRKASVLAALAREAQGDLFVVSDQDMRVDPAYLEAVAAPFDEPEVGLVTCPYRARSVYDLGGVLEALTINVDFIPSTLVARTLDRWLSFALGATMAVRRDVMNAIGGFDGLAPYLADDYLLGNRTFHAGWRVEMSPYVVDNVMPPTGVSQYFAHQLRWSRGYRVCRPHGYFFSVLMNGTVFALGSMLLGWGTGLLGAWLLFRWLVASFLFGRVVGRAAPLGWLLLVPVKDLVSLVIWALAVTGNRVEWGGQQFVLTADGRLKPPAGTWDQKVLQSVETPAEA